MYIILNYVNGRAAGAETQQRKELSFAVVLQLCRSQHGATALGPHAAGTIESDAAHAFIGAMQVLAEAAHHLHA